MLKRKSIVLQSAALMLGILTLGSCSGDGDTLPTPVNPQGKNYKFTVTVTGANHDAEMDYVSVVLASSSVSQNKSIWKVNGTVRTNEEVIGLGEDDFATTNTYVIESTEPLRLTQANIQCINFDTPYTISFKAEVDGQVKQDDQNVTVSEGNDYTHQFSF